MNKALIQIFIFSFLLMLGLACGNSSKQEAQKQAEQTSQKPAPESKLSFSKYTGSIYTIQTYDKQRLLETAQCFVVGKQLIAAPFSIFKGATRAVVKQLNGEQQFEINAYKAYDRILDVIILVSDEAIGNPLNFYTGNQIKGVKTYKVRKKTSNVLPIGVGKCLQEQIIQGERFFKITNQIFKHETGAPIFVSNGKILGMAVIKYIMYEPTYMVIPAIELTSFLKRNSEESVKKLNQINNANAQRNANIKRIRLLTDYGEIAIRLYNETPSYRDNFVKLAEEGYYDSLLIHRVIRDFGIQSGAADTRHALEDDPVGWRGPGYTIPAHIEPSLFHKRGAIGVPRLPDTQNKKMRSNGSQFYIVTGRKYIDSELDELEEANKIKFTPEQREIYKTVGGAPHIDGSYTVFGEVVSGIEVADRITNVAVGKEFRPQKDIRLKKVIIEY